MKLHTIINHMTPKKNKVDVSTETKKRTIKNRQNWQNTTSKKNRRNQNG